jgi:hypothetical protein
MVLADKVISIRLYDFGEAILLDLRWVIDIAKAVRSIEPDALAAHVAFDNADMLARIKAIRKDAVKLQDRHRAYSGKRHQPK